MSDKELEDKLKSLKAQQMQAKEIYIKYQGAIEFLEELIKEKASKK